MTKDKSLCGRCHQIIFEWLMRFPSNKFDKNFEFLSSASYSGTAFRIIVPNTAFATCQVRLQLTSESYSSSLKSDLKCI